MCVLDKLNYMIWLNVVVGLVFQDLCENLIKQDSVAKFVWRAT